MDFNQFILAKKCYSNQCDYWTHAKHLETCPNCGGVLQTLYDYYQLFNLTPPNDLEPLPWFFEELSRSYKKLSFEFHPDRNLSPHAHQDFAIIQMGYQTLKNQNERENYHQDLIWYDELNRQNQIEDDEFQIYQNPHSHHNLYNSQESSYSNEPIVNQSPTKQPQPVDEKFTFNQVNLVSGLTLAFLGFALNYFYTKNLYISSVIFFAVISLAIVWKTFYAFTITLVELAGIGVIGYFIFKGNLIGGIIFTFGLFLYFLKFRKKIQSVLPS